MRGFPLSEAYGWFQSSQERGRTAEVCSLSAVMLVPGYRRVAGRRVLGSEQLKDTSSGGDPDRNADQTLGEGEGGHRGGQVPDLLV